MNVLIEAWQTLTAGKIPPCLVTFNRMYDILKIVSLNLFEKYKLYRVIAFPLSILNQTYARLKIRRRKLESQLALQTYVLLSDSDLTHCEVRDI